MTDAVLRDVSLGITTRLGPVAREVDWMNPVSVAAEHNGDTGLAGHDLVAKIFDSRLPGVREIVIREGQVYPIELERIPYEIVHAPVGGGPERR